MTRGHPPSKARYYHKRAAEARKNGLCTRCFSRPAKHGKSSCAKCMKVQALNYWRTKPAYKKLGGKQNAIQLI